MKITSHNLYKTLDTKDGQKVARVRFQKYDGDTCVYIRTYCDPYGGNPKDLKLFSSAKNNHFHWSFSDVLKSKLISIVDDMDSNQKDDTDIGNYDATHARQIWNALAADGWSTVWM